MSLAKDSDHFDNMIIDIANAIDRGEEAETTLDEYEIQGTEREAMATTIANMKALHAIDRNHVWAYYLRNMTRPAVIAEGKVDAIVGNPPWLTYKQSADIIRTELRQMSETRYGIWAGGKNSANQDVAGLFYCRSAELYLREGGSIGMVMPHSALRSEHYLKFRKGNYAESVRGRGRNRRSPQSMGLDFSVKMPWDLDNLEPNTFFPIPASVIFARMSDQYGSRELDSIRANPLAPGDVEIWSGPTGTSQVKRTVADLRHDDGEFHSIYSGYARRGADLFDRRLYFVATEPNKTMLAAPGTYKTYPQAGTQDKKKYSVQDLDGLTVHEDNLFDVHLGETLAPYITLEPRQVVLPIDKQSMVMPLDHSDCDRDEETERCKRQNCAVDKQSLDPRMRHRWEIMEHLWDANKGKSKFSLTRNLNHLNKMTSQLEYLRGSDTGIVRIAYTAIGQPTAALITDDKAILDTSLYQVACRSRNEAYYLLSIINSTTLAAETKPFCTTNWAREIRNLHKHLWKLPIPEFDPDDDLHIWLAKLGYAAETEAYREIADIKNNDKPPTTKVARDKLRNDWQPTSEIAAAIEDAVVKLLE